MSVTSVDRDYEELAITLIANFDAPIDHVWELWSDPRKLERWLGPPGYPATVEKHDLRTGGDITFFMTGPDGDRSWGKWQVTALDPPTALEFADVFTEADGTPTPDMPGGAVMVHLTERDTGTRMELHWAFDSREDMEKWVSFGSVKGLQEAVGQMDALLSGLS